MAGATAEALQRIEAAIGQTTALTEARLVAVDGLRQEFLRHGLSGGAR